MAVFTVADVVPAAVLRWPVAVVGAVGVAVTLDSTGAALAGGLALALGLSLPALRSTVGAPVSALLVVGAWLGVYLTAPDTELVLAVSAVLAPVLVAHELAARWGPPPSSFALAGLLVWTATEDARGRAGAAVGVLTCLAVLLLPVIATRTRTQPKEPWRLFGIVAVLAAAVLVCSRVAGLKEDARTAAAIAVPTLGLAWALSAALLHRGAGRSASGRRPD